MTNRQYVAHILFIQDLNEHFRDTELAKPRVWDDLTLGTGESIGALAEHMAQWDYGQESEIDTHLLHELNAHERRWLIRPSRDDNGHYAYDQPWDVMLYLSDAQPGDYILTFHDQLRYAALDRVLAMPTFTYTVTVEAPGEAEAEQVMAERLAHDEDYGFPYTVNFQITPKPEQIDDVPGYWGVRNERTGDTVEPFETYIQANDWMDENADDDSFELYFVSTPNTKEAS